MKDFIEKHAFGLILILAFVLRLYRLDDADFWYDEAFTGIAIKESFSGMLAMIIQDVHPPLYYLAVKLFSIPFDYSVFGIRFFSLVFGMLGVWGIYLFVKELIDRKAALYASLIAAVSPFAIQYSQEGRMYAMFGCLLIFSVYFFLKALKTEAWKYRLLWSVFLGLAFLTHYLAIIYAPLFYVAYIVWKIANREPKRQQLFKSLIPDRKLIVGYGISVIVFSMWLPKFLGHLGRGSLDWIEPAKLSDIFLNAQIFLFGIPRGWYSGMSAPNAIYGVGNFTIYVLVVILLSLVVARLWKWNRRVTAILLVFSLGFMLELVALSLAGKHYLVARYAIPSAYFLFAILGVWLSALNLKQTIVSMGIYVALLFLIVHNPYPTGYNQFADNLVKYEGKTFYTLNSFDYVIAKYYLGPKRLVLHNIDWPQYDSSAWAAIGKEKLRKTEDYNVLKSDENGLIIYNTQVKFEDRSDKSFNPSEFLLVDQYDNISVYRSEPMR